MMLLCEYHTVRTST